MKIAVWILVIIIFLYTVGFAFKLWKDKNKAGSIAVFTLAIISIIVPFFSNLR